MTAPPVAKDCRAEDADAVAKWCLESMRAMLQRQLPDGIAPGVLRLYDAAAKHVRFEVSTLYGSEVGG